MAVGDDATAGGYPLVPGSGDQGLFKYGNREINRTRDFVAQLKKLIPSGASGFRSAAGITSGTSAPANSSGANGDIYFKIV